MAVQLAGDRVGEGGPVVVPGEGQLRAFLVRIFRLHVPWRRVRRNGPGVRVQPADNPVALRVVFVVFPDPAHIIHPIQTGTAVPLPGEALAQIRLQSGGGEGHGGASVNIQNEDGAVRQRQRQPVAAEETAAAVAGRQLPDPAPVRGGHGQVEIAHCPGAPLVLILARDLAPVQQQKRGVGVCQPVPRHFNFRVDRRRHQPPVGGDKPQSGEGTHVAVSLQIAADVRQQRPIVPAGLERAVLPVGIGIGILFLYGLIGRQLGPVGVHRRDGFRLRGGFRGGSGAARQQDQRQQGNCQPLHAPSPTSSTET